jgi:WD40 repeat protein
VSPYAVTVGVNNPVSYWDIDHVKATSEVPIKAKLNCIDISSNGRLLAAGSEECTVK